MVSFFVGILLIPRSYNTHKLLSQYSDLGIFVEIHQISTSPNLILWQMTCVPLQVKFNTWFGFTHCILNSTCIVLKQVFMNKKCVLLFYFTSVNITFMFYKGTTVNDLGAESIEKNSRKKNYGHSTGNKKGLPWDFFFSKVFPAEKRNSFSIFPCPPRSLMVPLQETENKGN